MQTKNVLKKTHPAVCNFLARELLASTSAAAIKRTATPKIQPDNTKGVAMNTKAHTLRDLIVVTVSTFRISVLHIEHVVLCKALIDLIKHSL